MEVNGFSQFPNVTVNNLYYPEEQSIIINPKSPNIPVAGANIADTAGNFYFFISRTRLPLSFLTGSYARNQTITGKPSLPVNMLKD